jgi:hypothetical protein
MLVLLLFLLKKALRLPPAHAVLFIGRTTPTLGSGFFLLFQPGTSRSQVLRTLVMLALV